MSENRRNRNNVMICRQPATRWLDALPSGNGTLGALAYGNIKNDFVVINHEALWFRRPKPTLPDLSGCLPQIRALLKQGRYREAGVIYGDKLKEAGYENPIDPYHPAFDIWIDTTTVGAFQQYRHELNFENGEISLSWTDSGVKFGRNLFVSRTDDLIAMRIHGSRPGSLNLQLSLIPHGQRYAFWLTDPKEMNIENIRYELFPENGWIRMNGRYADGNEFGGLARVCVEGGRTTAVERLIKIEQADSVLILLKLFANEPAVAAQARMQQEFAAISPDYDKLLKRHAAEHGKIFRRVNLDLNAGADRDRPNDDLLTSAYEGNVPTALIERMYAFGRYLLICSSRPGGLPANLQGVWNGDYHPMWSADFHNDENIQMNYWQALPGNMPELTIPYFDYYESSLADFRANAKFIYGCRGIATPVAQSTHGLIYGDVWPNWTAGAGWLAQLFYDYWLFTGDREFLARRAVPFMKEVALFYEDFLVAGSDGRLMFAPSLSPENTPDIPDASLCTINATMDVAIAREVLGNLCTACELLGVERENLPRWKQMLSKLPEYEINSDGAIKEWIHPGLKDNYQHRHQSHIYPLFPGIEVTKENNPKLFEACRVAVEKRLCIGLSSQTGWSLAHMANIYARLGEGGRALECLELLSRSCLGPNLFTYHNDWRFQGMTCLWCYPPPFQIDANFGWTAAIQEMLLYSTPGVIRVLPALPKKWARGAISGLLARGGIEVDIAWDMVKKKIAITLRPRQDCDVTVVWPVKPKSIKCSSAEVQRSEYGTRARVLKLSAARATKIEVAW